jgi:hypothetical protein
MSIFPARASFINLGCKQDINELIDNPDTHYSHDSENDKFHAVTSFPNQDTLQREFPPERRLLDALAYLYYTTPKIEQNQPGYL